MRQVFWPVYALCESVTSRKLVLKYINTVTALGSGLRTERGLRVDVAHTLAECSFSREAVRIYVDENAEVRALGLRRGPHLFLEHCAVPGRNPVKVCA